MSSHRDAIARKRTVVPQNESVLTQRRPRLVMDANCTTCGLIDSRDPLAVQNAALKHAAQTGHVIVLNGTADLPCNDAA